MNLIGIGVALVLIGSFLLLFAASVEQWIRDRFGERKRAERRGHGREEETL